MVRYLSFCLDKWLFLFWGACGALFAQEDYSLAFIYIGKPPSCAYTSLEQARLMNQECPIYFLVDQAGCHQFTKSERKFFLEHKISVVDISRLPVTPEHELFYRVSTLNKLFKHGLGNRATEKFFYLYDFLAYSQIQNLIQLEIDGMLYLDVEELLPIFSNMQGKLAGICQSETECVPGFLFIKDVNIWGRYINHVLAEMEAYQGENPDVDLNDMRTLGNFRKSNKDHFLNLPVLMPECAAHFGQKELSSTPEDTSLEFFFSNSSRFPGYLFDGAALGIYTNGYDQTLYPVGTTKDVRWKSFFDPSCMQFYWGSDKIGRPVPYAKVGEASYRLVNLRFQSKHPEEFTSSKEPEEDAPAQLD